MIINIHPQNPQEKEIKRVVDILENGGIIIYPTDTLYAFGCSIFDQKAVNKICQLKQIDPKKVPLSFVCSNISHISEYATLHNNTFSLLKKNLPGAFTFLLKGNHNLPRLFKEKKTVGVRIPDNKIVRSIVEILNHPIVSTSLFIDDNEPEYATDPDLIHEKYGHIVDCVIDGGYGTLDVSTIVDCTEDSFEIIRQGKGILK
ncbi:MAG TPA: L-threonylcarbamoyladenylate synthase [Paludibacteraceae bacterium]|nr:L-threonylcarbamoyladenylate synthase [Paludibacteraceae bacterium]